MTATEKHRCIAANAPKMLEWIRTRGGVAVWESIDLSNPGASWSAPVLDMFGATNVKPTWQAANEPARVITDAAEIVVDVPKEVKRFRVGVRMGSQGMSLKVTDGGTRRIRKEVSKAGDDAWYEFDYEAQEAVIFVPGSSQTLDEWAKEKGV